MLSRLLSLFTTLNSISPFLSSITALASEHPVSMSFSALYTPTHAGPDEAGGGEG